MNQSIHINGTTLRVITTPAQSIKLVSAGPPGKRGERGERGEVGPIADVDANLPNFVLIFENRLI